MLFNSYIFLFVFLPVTLTVFFLIGGRGHHRIAIAWLVGASLFFYGWWNPAYLGLILFSILFNYSVGVNLGTTNGHSTYRSRLILTFGVLINIGLLAHFKYANFFIDSINYSMGTGWQLEPVLLPLAISFFTFQQIAYLVDAYQGKTREYNFLHYCLFVTFFPQLIAGPIVHHREMLPQFSRDSIYRLNYRSLSIGLTIFFIGLFKKVIIADNVALYATPVFDAAEAGDPLNFYLAWQGTIAYTLQLYFDFSGYSDMAIGLGRMFGIKLPLNFNSPYQAVNIIDFWRRWHITLSRFLRDYLYIPLGGSRKGRSRRYINLLITMVLGGLWHGAGWTFVIWGGLHGAYLIINHAWQRLHPRPWGYWWSRTVARLLTLLAVMVGWVFFRAETFAGAVQVLRGMTNLPDALHGNIGFLENILGFAGFRFEGGYVTAEYYSGLVWLVFWICILWFWPNTQQWMARIKPAIDAHVKPADQPFREFWQRFRWRPSPAWAITTAGIATAAVLGMSQVSEFLYFQF